MKNMKILVAAACCVAMVAASGRAADASYVRVKGERVNLRAAPKGDSEVVGQVSAPELLVLLGDAQEPWVKVAPPDSVNLWIFASLVKDGKVAVNKAQVRAGAGLNFNVVGQLERGDAVTLRDKNGRVGDWLKIAPFPGSYVWVTNAYVEAAVVPRPVPKPEPKAEPAPAKVDRQTVSIAPPPSTAPLPPEPITDHKPAPSAASSIKKSPRQDMLAKKGSDVVIGPAKVPATRLRLDVVQAEKGAFAGTLTSSAVGTSAPTRYRLVRFGADGKPVTVCYVLGNSKQLDALKGDTLTFEGAIYWFKDAGDIPTVYAETILRNRK